jgi:hypothetical protein
MHLLCICTHVNMGTWQMQGTMAFILRSDFTIHPDLIAMMNAGSVQRQVHAVQLAHDTFKPCKGNMCKTCMCSSFARCMT